MKLLEPLLFEPEHSCGSKQETTSEYLCTFCTKKQAIKITKHIQVCLDHYKEYYESYED